MSGPGAVERPRSDPEGAAVRTDQLARAITARTSRSSITISTRTPTPLLYARCSTSIRKRRFPTAGSSRRTGGAARADRSSSCSTPASSTRTAISMSSIEYAKADRRRHPDARHGPQSRAGSGGPCTCCRSSGSATPGRGSDPSKRPQLARCDGRADRRVEHHADSGTLRLTATAAANCCSARTRPTRRRLSGMRAPRLFQGRLPRVSSSNGDRCGEPGARGTKAAAHHL